MFVKVKMISVETTPGMVVEEGGRLKENGRRGEFMYI
jgi:hypothetical protein